MPHEHESLYKALTAMAGIVALELFALSQGINGVALAAVIGALAGLGGFVLGKGRSGNGG